MKEGDVSFWDLRHSDPWKAEGVLRLQQIKTLRATDPARADLEEEKFKRFLASKPILEALGHVQQDFAEPLALCAKRFGTDLWLDCLLFEAAWAARAHSNPDLLRVLTALKIASTEPSFAPLLTGTDGHTLSGIANKYLENVAPTVIVGAQRPAFLKELAALFSPEPEADKAYIRGLVRGLARTLQLVDAATVFGKVPLPEWETRVGDEIYNLRIGTSDGVKPDKRRADGERKPEHFVRVVLIGLFGIDKETAKQWVRGMRK